MEKLIRYWNQNRRQIIIIIAVVAFALILIQTVNNLLKTSENKVAEEKKAITEGKPIESVITGQTISVEQTENNMSVIEDFVNKCNNKQYQQAYELLTNECKEEFHGSMNEFYNNYCKKIFEINKAYSLDLWLSQSGMQTYKITYYTNNLLATGGKTMENNIEDYITISYQDGTRKISVDGLITSQQINQSQVINNVEIEINSKRVYKDYEIFKMLVKNNTQKTILLSNGNNQDICLVGENNTKYPAFLNEMLDTNLEIEAGRQKEIQIKFSKLYNPYRTIKRIEFSNIILDKEQNIENSTDENLEKIAITIPL